MRDIIERSRRHLRGLPVRRLEVEHEARNEDCRQPVPPIKNDVSESQCTKSDIKGEYLRISERGDDARVRSWLVDLLDMVSLVKREK